MYYFNKTLHQYVFESTLQSLNVRSEAYGAVECGVGIEPPAVKPPVRFVPFCLHSVIFRAVFEVSVLHKTPVRSRDPPTENTGG